MDGLAAKKVMQMWTEKEDCINYTMLKLLSKDAKVGNQILTLKKICRRKNTKQS